MKVILKEDVKDLGRMGEVVTVKDGYARNYLMPRGLALEANTKNVRQFEHNRKQIMEMARRIKTSAEALAQKIAATVVTIKAKAGEEDKLFGSVTAMDIAEALKEQGVEVDKKKIIIDEPIKRLGEYKVTVKLHSDVSSEVTVRVEPE